jgi:hypothetical protein
MLIDDDMGDHAAAAITTTTAAPPTTAASPCSWGGNREHWQESLKGDNHGRAAGTPHHRCSQGVYGARDDNDEQDEQDDRTTGRQWQDDDARRLLKQTRSGGTGTGFIRVWVRVEVE